MLSVSIRLAAAAILLCTNWGKAASVRSTWQIPSLDFIERGASSLATDVGQRALPGRNTGYETLNQLCRSKSRNLLPAFGFPPARNAHKVSDICQVLSKRSVVVLISLVTLVNGGDTVQTWLFLRWVTIRVTSASTSCNCLFSHAKFVGVLGVTWNGFYIK